MSNGVILSKAKDLLAGRKRSFVCYQGPWMLFSAVPAALTAASPLRFLRIAGP